MLLAGKKVGFALTGSFCTFEKTITQISRLIEEGADILPIMSFNAYNIDSKFGKSKDFIEKIEKKIRINQKMYSTEKLDETMKKVVDKINIAVKEVKRELTEEEKNEIINECYKENF